MTDLGPRDSLDQVRRELLAERFAPVTRRRASSTRTRIKPDTAEDNDISRAYRRRVLNLALSETWPVARDATA